MGGGDLGSVLALGQRVAGLGVSFVPPNVAVPRRFRVGGRGHLHVVLRLGSGCWSLGGGSVPPAVGSVEGEGGGRACVRSSRLRVSGWERGEV